MKKAIIISTIIHLLFLGSFYIKLFRRHQYIDPSKIVNVHFMTQAQAQAAEKPVAKQAEQPVKENKIEDKTKIAQSISEALHKLLDSRKKVTFAEPTPTPRTSKSSQEKQSDSKNVSSSQPRDGIYSDIADFDARHASYLSLIRSLISNAWEPPPRSYGSIKRKCAVKFVIYRNGAVSDIVITQQSGNFAFDQTAMNAVKMAAPFSPLPPEFSGGSLGIYLPFEDEE